MNKIHYSSNQDEKSMKCGCDWRLLDYRTRLVLACHGAQEKNKELELSLSTLFREEEVFWTQKAKADWLCLGDVNTKVFHLQATIRRKRNKIDRIKINDNSWITEPNDIVSFFVSDFKRRFSVDRLPNRGKMEEFLSVVAPCINDNDNSMLMQHVNEDKILDAVKSIGQFKAPGPDEIHATFYQNNWNAVSSSVVKLVQHAFENGASLKLLNHTNIVLIPKVTKPETVNHFRLINLCNVSYKIITKVIIRRLKPLLGKYISKNHGAFAPGRSIHDNILVALRLI